MQKPAPLPSVVLFNPSLPSMGKKKVPAGQTTVTGLWPFPDGYSLWAGTCNLNDPAASGGTRADPVKPRRADRDGTCRAEAGEVDNE